MNQDSFEFAVSPLKASNRMGSPVGDGLISAFKPSKIPSPPCNDSMTVDSCTTPSNKFSVHKVRIITLHLLLTLEFAANLFRGHVWKSR